MAENASRSVSRVRIASFDRAVIGVFMLVIVLCTSAIGYFVNSLNGGIQENRRIGCVNRYVNAQQYDPACNHFVEDFKREHPEVRPRPMGSP